MKPSAGTAPPSSSTAVVPWLPPLDTLPTLPDTISLDNSPAILASNLSLPWAHLRLGLPFPLLERPKSWSPSSLLNWFLRDTRELTTWREVNTLPWSSLQLTSLELARRQWREREQVNSTMDVLLRLLFFPSFRNITSQDLSQLLPITPDGIKQPLALREYQSDSWYHSSSTQTNVWHGEYVVNSLLSAEVVYTCILQTIQYWNNDCPELVWGISRFKNSLLPSR